MSRSRESVTSSVAARSRRRVLGFAVLGLGVVLVSALALRHEGLERSRFEFRARTATLALALGSRLSTPLGVVRSIPAFFAGSSVVERDEFRAFVESSIAMYPSIDYIGFAPVIDASERAGLEVAANDHGWPGFETRERYGDHTLGRSRARTEYVPLVFGEPANVAPLGLDLGAPGDASRQAIRDALAGGRVVTSVSGADGASDAIATYAPLQLEARSTPDPRIPRSGVAVVVVRTNRAIGSMLDEGLDRGMIVELLDAPSSDSPRVLHSTRSRRRGPVEVDPSETILERFDIDGHPFAFRFIPLRGTIASGPLPYFVGGLGTLLVFALAIAMLASDSARRLQQQVDATKQLGPYRLVRKIGEGGMGAVYEAEHALLRRPTAVKVISDQQAPATALERFEREARATSLLTHPNTIVVFDYGRTEAGVFYYAMEYLKGLTLDEVVARAGPMPASRVVHILRQIAGSLAEAHAAGLVHRDVKPANVMLCSRGGIDDFVKVLDFGLVKDLSSLRSGTVSVDGQAVGTPRYMAPETILDGAHAAPAADIYGVGAVAYLMLTGREVVAANGIASIAAHHLSARVDSPSQRSGRAVPPALDALVTRCLSPDPRARPADGAELLDALERCGIAPWTREQAREARVALEPRASSDPGFAAGDTLAVDLHGRVIERAASDEHRETA